VAVFVMTSTMTQVGIAWTGTAPGEPGTQTVSGTITSATDISGMLYEVEYSLEVDEQEFTSFTSGGWKVKKSGLKSGSIKLSFYQDFAASQTDALFGLGGTVAGFGLSPYIDIKATNSARSATNPSYVAQFLNNGWTPIGGSVGDKGIVSVTYPHSGLPARLTS
jgi:hypothetical protein